MREIILVHYGEIALKGKNRGFFENRLAQNIKDILIGYKLSIKRNFGRIVIEIEDESKRPEIHKDISEKLQQVFGISFFAFANRLESKTEKIKIQCFSHFKKALKNKEKFTFKIETRRADKNFPLTSQEINEKIGRFICQKFPRAKVKLKTPFLTCFIELVNKNAFLYSQKIKGLDGLPVGVSGKVVSLISGGIDSPVAAYLAAKRGTKNIFLHFHSAPYTDAASQEKVSALVKILKQFQVGSKIYFVPLIAIQKEIVLKTPAKFRVILYRRLMLRIAEIIAKKEGALALVSGESLGQVASQTLANLSVIEQAVNMPILRPLICFDKQEIIDLAKKINTYDISILPHQDCCSLFTPKHPATAAKMKDILEAEKNLNIDKLIKQAIEDLRIEEIK